MCNRVWEEDNPYFFENQKTKTTNAHTIHFFTCFSFSFSSNENTTQITSKHGIRVSVDSGNAQGGEDNSTGNEATNKQTHMQTESE